jgi:hypothetical protein
MKEGCPPVVMRSLPGAALFILKLAVTDSAVNHTTNDAKFLAP